mmetsp:Transcript_19731/g.54271  ORF Transcript_19731/g.54271 Transcript_19731/m.54271 type:complete len:249 (+) Transcript_19731:194-940(+)
MSGSTRPLFSHSRHIGLTFTMFTILLYSLVTPHLSMMEAQRSASVTANSSFVAHSRNCVAGAPLPDTTSLACLDIETIAFRFLMAVCSTVSATSDASSAALFMATSSCASALVSGDSFFIILSMPDETCVAIQTASTSSAGAWILMASLAAKPPTLEHTFTALVAVRPSKSKTPATTFVCPSLSKSLSTSVSASCVSPPPPHTQQCFSGYLAASPNTPLLSASGFPAAHHPQFLYASQFQPLDVRFLS